MSQWPGACLLGCSRGLLDKLGCLVPEKCCQSAFATSSYPADIILMECICDHLSLLLLRFAVLIDASR